MIASDNSDSRTLDQRRIDQLIAHVNEQIELLAFDEPDPGLLRQMVEGLSDTREAARLRLIEAFGQIGEPATPFLLDGLVNHAQTPARQACCHSLASIGDPQAVSGLVQVLQNDADIVVKGAAASALARVGEPAFKPLCKVLASPMEDESCKGQAAWAIASMSSEISEQLYHATNDPSATVRTAVIGAIAQLARQTKDPNAVKFIRAALSDPSPEVRIEAAADLARLNDQDAYQTLINLLGDPEAQVRKSVILALGKFDQAETAEAIAPLTADPSPQVQRVANLVLTQLRN